MKIVYKVMLVLCIISLSISLVLDILVEKSDSIEFISGMLTGFSLVMMVLFLINIIRKRKVKNDNI